MGHEICLGALPFGNTLDERTSFEILDRFVDAGGTFIDTANNYAFWTGTGDESEDMLGRWIKARGNRDSLYLATKMGARPLTPGTGLENAEGLSATAVKAAIDGSLTRLGIDRVDVFYAHIEDRAVPLEETLGAFAELVDAGKVTTIGASNHATWRLERARALAKANGWPLFTYVQGRHSYLRPRPNAVLNEAGHTQLTDELFDYARAEGDLKLVAYTTLLFGAYTNPEKPLQEYYDHPGTTRRLRVLNEVAAELGVTTNQVVLAWLLHSDPPVVPIVGVSAVAQLEEALQAREIELDGDLMSRLDAAR
ncbi:aldo/keto reductase [Lentzea tibetensis]|uniref:Aldo/keto reductase n=1 Tax=Lentzea tibetensis TaxID=2591470 RepID=A0A563EYK6_9PSEU|nr:aldo/keto reductase [Lentzea tibetensis]TWP52224.1 aldo/keto reductase [Lentzea tibetensis]